MTLTYEYGGGKERNEEKIIKWKNARQKDFRFCMKKKKRTKEERIVEKETLNYGGERRNKGRILTKRKKTRVDEVTLEYARERKKLRTFRSIYYTFPPF